MAENRKSYNTTLRTDLVKKLRILAALSEKRQNDLLEEAIQDLLEKYRISEGYLQPNPTKGKNRKNKN